MKKQASPAVPAIYSKANLFINSKHKTSLIANRIMAISFAKIQDAEEDLEGSIKVQINTSELRALLNVSGNGLYENLNKASAELTGKSIGITDETSHTFTYIAVVTAATFSGGVFSIEYNKKLNNYLKNLNSSFTLLDLSTMLSFKSNYSFRLCEYLKSRAYSPKGINIKEYSIQVSLAELKLILGVINADQPSIRRYLNNKDNPNFEEAVEQAADQQFKDFRDFKKRVMQPAIDEINKKSDMDIEVEYLKAGYGGKVKSLKFIVRYKKDNNITIKTEYDPEKIKFCEDVKKIIEEDISLADALKISEIASYNIEIIKEKYEIAKARNSIDDIVAWMLSAIKNDYKKGVKKQKESEHMSNKRDYDYAKLEQMVLELK